MKHAASLVCAMALAGVSASAFADEAQGRQAFVRAELGRSDTETSISGGGPTISEDETAAGFGGGYWFNANFAVEGTYALLYNRELRHDFELDIFALGAGIVGKKNFGADGNGFYAAGRVGIAHVVTQVRDDLDVEDDENSTKPYWGVAVGYDFNRHFGLGLNYTRYEADFDFVEIESELLSISGEYRF